MGKVHIGINFEFVRHADKPFLWAVESVPLFFFIPSWRGIYTRRYTYSIQNDITGSVNFNTLYDKQVDPAQQNNLFGSLHYRKIQAYLHQLTEAWLNRFNDPFVDSKTLLHVCFGTTNITLHKPGQTGKLPGRPIDLLKRLKKKSLSAKNVSDKLVGGLTGYK